MPTPTAGVAQTAAGIICIPAASGDGSVKETQRDPAEKAGRSVHEQSQRIVAATYSVYRKKRSASILS